MGNKKNFLQKKKFTVKPIGNLPLIFEGLTISKSLHLNNQVDIDLYIYYPVKNYFCRPNMHKPLKQSLISKFVYILLHKINLFLHKAVVKENNFFSNIFIFFYFCISKVYFNYGITSQFIIPKKFLNKYRKVKIENIIFLVPEKTREYLIWRYGNGWKTPNSNFRLNDGEMLVLNNLKKYLW